MKKGIQVILGVVVAVAALHTPNSALALSLSAGTPIIAIDGNSDHNVTVNLSSIEVSPYFEYGYFLNGGTAFTAISSAYPTSFLGGDIIDFALRRLGTDKIYSLSGDSSDPTYQVTMLFAGEVTDGSPQQPADWNSPFFYGAVLEWAFSEYKDVTTGEVVIQQYPSCSKCTPNDGIAPYRSPVRVSEPTPLLLLGLGLVGLGLLRLKRPA